MAGDTERLIAAARRLEVPEGVLAPVRAGLAEGRDASWALQELLKRSGLEPRQVALLRKELESPSPGPTAGSPNTPTLPLPELGSRTQLETRELKIEVREVTRGQSARLRVQPGSVVGDRFKLEEEIGRGSQGIVYRARDESLQRDVAIKVLRGDAPGASRERFLREAQTVSRLRHPGIVLVYEAGAVGERGLYYAMELVRGHSLEDVLEAEGALAPERAVRIIEAVAHAVHHAHDAGLVHRDLKPGNVLLDPDETPRIADFGLVTLAEGTRLTATRSVVGTPVYMAPEQAQGERVDRRADVYSLGAILYEALCGAPPFVGDTPLAIFRKVVEEDPVPLRRVNAAIPEGLERVCLRALEKDPRGRFPTAAAFARDLRRALEGLALISPGSPVPRGIRGLRRAGARNRGLTGLAFGLLLGVAMGVALRGPAPPRTPAPLPSLAAVISVAPDPVRAGARELLVKRARHERGRGLPEAAIDWLRTLGPEELRRDPGAGADLARARGLEALAWLDLGRDDSARAAVGLGTLWSPAEPLLAAASAVLAFRGGDPILGERELARAALYGGGLPEVQQAVARWGSPPVRAAALERAVALTEPEPWPVLLRDRIRFHLDQGDLPAARADAVRLVAARLPPQVMSGPFALEAVLAEGDAVVLREGLLALGKDADLERRALAARALGLLSR